MRRSALESAFRYDRRRRHRQSLIGAAFQVSGRLACLGTAQHLKDKFGNGFQLEVNAVEGRLADVKALVGRVFPGSELLEEQSANVRYRVPKRRSIGDMFRVVESESGGLVDSYSISDISLEQIFIYFASQQTEEVGHVRGLAPMRIPSNADVVVPVDGAVAAENP